VDAQISVAHERLGDFRDAGFELGLSAAAALACRLSGQSLDRTLTARWR
jgi:hypothetical protein